MFHRKPIVAVAIATFIVGAGFHLETMRLAQQVIRYDTIIFEDPRTQSPIESDAIGLPLIEWCRAVVSAGSARNLAPTKELIGQTFDTERLEKEIAREFARCDQELVDMQSHDLDAPILTTRWRPRVLYLRLLNPPRQEVPKLVEVSKAAGASRIKVLFDERIPSRQECSADSISDQSFAETTPIPDTLLFTVFGLPL